MEHTRDNRRRGLALLAAGLVFGVGAAATLAAWNDSESATGTFTSGSFNLEGSTTNATTGFADHNVDKGNAAATLSFTLAETTKAMSPGDIVYAPLWVRLGSTTTNGATIIPSAITAGTGGNEAHLSYSIRAIAADATCDAAATGTVVATGATLSALTTPTQVSLAKGATTGTAGAAVQLCFAVTAAADIVQGTTGSATWKFTATSVAN